MCSAETRLTFCLHINHKIISSIFYLKQNQSTALCILWLLMSSKCLKSDWMRIFRKNSYISAHFSSASQWFLFTNLRKIFKYVWITENLMTSSSKTDTWFSDCKRFSIVWLRSDSLSSLTSFLLFINFAIKKEMNEKLLFTSDMNCLNF